MLTPCFPRNRRKFFGSGTPPNRHFLGCSRTVPPTTQPPRGALPGLGSGFDSQKDPNGPSGGPSEVGSKIPILMLNLKVKIAADGTKMVFYLTNVTNAVISSQPSVCIGGGLHAPIHIFQQSVWTRPVYLLKVR